MPHLNVFRFFLITLAHTRRPKKDGYQMIRGVYHHRPPPSKMASVTLGTENIQLTIHALNLQFAGREGTEGYDKTKLMHIHRRNRAYVWNREMQEKCLDSILKGYYIPPIICSSRVSDNVIRREVMEGGNRITTFRKILRNEVKVLTDEQKAIVQAHPITLVVMSNLTSVQQREMFRRINKNVKVTDGQLYDMSREDSPLVREACALLDEPNYPLREIITKHFFNTENNDNDKRSHLSTAVALVSGSLFGPDYITKLFSRQEEKIELQDVLDRNTIITKLGLVFEVFRMVDEQIPIANARKKKAQWTLGTYIGTILYDICTNPTAVRNIQEKWVTYIARVRKNEPNAEKAIEVKGACNLNREKLRKISKKVELYVQENRIVTDDELKAILGTPATRATFSDDSDDINDDEIDTNDDGNM